MSAGPRVFLVGAGPGDPGLLTVRTVEALRQADLVLYDQLVPKRLLDSAPQALKVCVDTIPACHPQRGPHIQQMMIEAAEQGHIVVRLKGGDPLIFGRGGEEAEALHAAGVAFEIVPGVTAALGAASFAGIPLTHRQHASAVAFVTGHECPGKPGRALDWSALARFPGTLVFYMGRKNLPAIVDALIAQGKDPATPAAIVERASQPRQRTISTTLEHLTTEAAAAGLTGPALTILGDVVLLREQIAWFEQKPLFGRRVLVTRPAGQDEALVRRLESLGAEVYRQPTVAIHPPDDWGPVDATIASLADYHWLVFTSVNGVSHFLDRLKQGGRDMRALGGVKLAAIGPATAAELRRYHLEPDVVPLSYRSEDLAATLLPLVRGQRVLLARADRGREVLREELAKSADVHQVAVYSQKDVAEANPDVLDLIRKRELDFVTLTSSNIARALDRLLDEESRAVLRSGAIPIVTISPVTSAAVKDLGWPVAAEAREYTADGVVEALLATVSKLPPLARRASEGS